MNSSRRQRSPRREPSGIRARLTEAEDTLRAIRGGEVDALVVAGARGPRVFTLEGSEHAYRVLIESMNEGALTLTADKTILYANHCFASMVKSPLEHVMGGSFRRFLSVEDRATLRPRMRHAGKSGSKIQVLLRAGDGTQLPAQLSIRSLPRNGLNRATVAMVVTDLTEARRNEIAIREFSSRLVQAQESERGRVARELHDHITQLLCATLIRSQALANGLSSRDGPSKAEAVKLREMLSEAADEVERISHDLRPSVLDELGLLAGLRATGAEFSERTGVPVKLTCVRLASRLHADTELTLYRIVQEALRNVREHARARSVTVSLSLRDGFVRLAIRDDGVGFDPHRRAAAPNGKTGFGFLGMRERATFAGGTFKVESARRAGTRIEVRIPVRPGAAAND